MNSSRRHVLACAASRADFSDDRAGLLTRIAVHPFDGPQRRFGIRPVPSSSTRSRSTRSSQPQDRFLRQWGAGRDARASYFQRIADGPDHQPGDAIPLEE